MREERKRRNGALVDEDLLAYNHLYEIQKLIDAHWERFKPVLRDKKRFTVYMERLQDFRNAPMHSRGLLPFERDLLAGIAGELRNSFTVWWSQQAPDMTFYPWIASVVDSLGNSLKTDGIVHVPTRLQVGDLVSFRCAGLMSRRCAR